jgi:hypothetical protein
LRWTSVFDLLSDSLLDDVLDDVGRRVVDAASFSNLGLFFDFGLVSGGEANDLAQEPLINRSKDLDGHDAELIGRAVLEIKAFQDGLESLVIHLELWRDLVRAFGYSAFLLEVKESGVIFLISPSGKVVHEARINVGSFA